MTKRKLIASAGTLFCLCHMASAQLLATYSKSFEEVKPAQLDGLRCAGLHTTNRAKNLAGEESFRWKPISTDHRTSTYRSSTVARRAPGEFLADFENATWFQFYYPETWQGLTGAALQTKRFTVRMEARFVGEVGNGSISAGNRTARSSAQGNAWQPLGTFEYDSAPSRANQPLFSTEGRIELDWFYPLPMPFDRIQSTAEFEVRVTVLSVEDGPGVSRIATSYPYDRRDRPRWID